MGDCNDQGPAAGPCDPPTIVPDSTHISVEAGEKEAAPPAAACFAGLSQSSHLTLLVCNKPTYPASGTDVDGRSSMIPSPDPTVVLPGDAGAAGLDHNAPNNGRAGETPQQQQGLAAAGLDSLQLPAFPEVDDSPGLPPKPRPGSARPSPSNQNNTSSAIVYSPAWRHLVRQVGAAAATRPSLCACKKLAVAAMLGNDDEKGGATQRPGRVCANRGKEADCLYRAFNDAPIVPSTTVSSKTLSLLLHMRKSDPSTPTEREGERAEEEEAQGKHGHGKRERGCDGEPGGGSPDGAKESGDCVKSEEDLRGVGEGKEHQHRHGQGATESLGERAASCDHGNVVLVEIRRWLMDCVASVHCADAALREAMSCLIPPELGQKHLSPDGGGQLIALHVAAVTLLVKSLATLPGVVQVEGAGKTASIFTSAQAVPPTAITPARRPASVCPQQPAGSARLSRQYSSTSQKMAAPVPIRASEMVAPSIWDLANMGGGEGLDNGSSRRGEGAAAGVGSGGQESGAAGQSVSGASSPAGGLRYSGASPADLMGGEGVDVDVDGTAAMLSTSVDSTLFLTEADQQLPGWGSKAAAAATAWPALGSRSRDCSKCGDGAYGGGGSSIGGAWADSADHGGATQGGSDAGVYRQGQGQGQQQVSEPSVVSSHSSTSSFYQCQYGEAGAPKRQKTDSSVGLAGVARPVGQHLQGYASLFGSDASAPSGSSFGGALAYSAYSKLGDLGIGGIGLGDLAGDSFGPSGVDVGSAWVDAVIDSESASSSSPFLLNDK